MNKLRLLRKKKGISQAQAAKAIGITTSYYGMIELGIRNPRLELAIKLAKYFNSSVEEIFFENTNNL